jgi:hypothetical protein
MAKNTPVWQMLNQPEPPIVNGYWSYGTVWTPDMRQRLHGPRELARAVYWYCWSHYYWHRKIVREIRQTLKQRFSHPEE